MSHAAPRDLDAHAADRSRSPVRSGRQSLSEDLQFAMCEVASLRHVLESRFSGFAELARLTAKEAAGECPWKGLADFVEDTRVTMLSVQGRSATCGMRYVLNTSCGFSFRPLWKSRWHPFGIVLSGWSSPPAREALLRLMRRCPL